MTTSSYTLDLNQFNINLSNPVSVSNGLNAALQYVQSNNIQELLLPTNTYVTSETIPVEMVSNVTLNLNGSTLKINPNALDHYAIVEFKGGITASHLINGIIQGDRYTHDYSQINNSQEWGTGISLGECTNSTVENVIVKEVIGYGITTTLGDNKIYNLGIPYTNLTTTTDGRITTINPIDMSSVPYGQFELGYNFEYFGYPYIQSKEYDVEFFDKDMNSLGTQTHVQQYKKITMPTNTAYAKFTFYQKNVPTSGNTDFDNAVIFITDYHQPTNITITGTTLDSNRTLGLAVLGGDTLLFDGNTFKNNGGQSPSYDVDLEDGWEYINNTIFKNNTFNSSNNIVGVAGDNTVFDNNTFNGWVYMYDRSTNYKFMNNTFASQTVYNYSTPIAITNNKYTNGAYAKYLKTSTLGKATIQGEIFIDANIISAAPTGSSYDPIVNANVSTKNQSGININGSFINGSFNYNGSLNNCTIVGSTINNSTIQLLDGNSLIQNSTISSSTLTSHAYIGTVTFNSNNMSNVFISQPGWGKSYSFTFNNNVISTINRFLEMSVPLTKVLSLTGNKITNTSTSSTIYIRNDVSSNLPNSSVKVTLKQNSFSQKAPSYVITSDPIPKTMFSFTSSLNTTNKGVTLNGIKYSN